MNARYCALLSFTLLLGLTFLPGCHNAPAEFAAPPVGFIHSDALPADVPAAAPLFAATFVPAPVDAHQVTHASLPPEPSDPDVVAQQAVQPSTAMASSASVASATSKIILADVGLLVCDPVASASSPSNLADFGDGCGHWLHLMAAGQAEFGRTALWTARARIQQELRRSNLRLTPADITPLPHIAGITHAACGTISGSPGRCTLSYTLYTLPSRLPIGPPIVETGTLSQVVAALPGIAHTLDARLGLTHAVLPLSPGLTTDELTRLGRDVKGAPLSDAELLSLTQMSVRSPFAGVYLLQTPVIQDQLILNKTVKTLMTQQPQNSLVLSDIGYKAPGALRPYAAQTALLFHRFPQSALLAHTEVWEQRVWGSRSDERAAAVRVTVDSPNDPDSWLTLSQTLSNIAQDLRQGRFAGDLTPTEWGYLNRLYRLIEADTTEATRLDLKYGHAWRQLAEAATFASDFGRASGAIWHAQTLDPNKAEVYSWGLEMFQAKWINDPTSLAKMASLATGQTYPDCDSAVSVTDELNDIGSVLKEPPYQAMASQVLAKLIAADRAALLTDPGDAFTHWDLAGALASAADPTSLREATIEYRITAHLLPNATDVHYWLARTLSQRGKDNEAIPELRKAVELNPYDADAHFQLGYDLKHEHQFAKALPELNLAMRLDPRNSEAHSGLGDLLLMQHQYAPASVQYREAVRIFPYAQEAWIGLCGTLDQTGHYDASLTAGQQAIHVDAYMTAPNPELEAEVHDNMADDYLHKKQWSASLSETSAAIASYAADPVAQENIAEAYWGEGKQAQARAQWEHVIALGNPMLTDVARKLLASHPAP